MAGCHPWLVYFLIWLLLAAVPEAFRELHTGEKEHQILLRVVSVAFATVISLECHPGG